MSGLLNTLHDLHQQHKERREERREGRQEQHGHGGHHKDDDYGSQPHHQRPYQGDDEDLRRPQSHPSQGQGHDYGSQPHHQRPYQGDDEDLRRPQSHPSQGQSQGHDYGSQPHHQRPYQGDDEDLRRPQSHPSQGQGQGHDYPPPSCLPPSARESSGFASQGGLDRGDFASDADIERMVATGEFSQRHGSEREGYEHSGANLERRNAQGRYDASPGPRPGQGYGEGANEHGRYDAPTGPPPGRGYQSQESHQQGYGSGHGGGPDRPNQYGPPQTQGRSQYDSPQGPGYGRGQENAPTGAFNASRDGEERYGSGHGGRTNDHSEHPYRGEAASYYNQQSAPGQGDRYTRLAGMAQEHGDDPELYRRATLGLQEKIQMQAQSRPSRRNEDDDDYKTHVDAHRKAYGNDDHGPMDADAIGAAAAMEAFKQTAAAAKSSNVNAPTGAFQAGKTSGGPSSKPARAAQEEVEKEETAAAHAGPTGGLQDKLMALAMSQAGKLFDKKNAGRPSGGDKAQDKAQAMQSAAATAMQLFTQYQTKGKLDPSDMSKVMGLAMNLL